MIELANHVTDNLMSISLSDAIILGIIFISVILTVVIIHWSESKTLCKILLTIALSLFVGIVLIVLKM